jgi:asparagine synthase (glutamine-hydrolysing)
MCGITGAVWTDASLAVDQDCLRRMTDVLRHRGPDEEGFYHSGLPGDGGVVPGVALGFRRLAIIDLATGHQPLANEDGTVWVVFNGEIYNYRALRRRLEGNGHIFRTHSDTESIVHLYEDEGVECFSHLNGMFAIAIWDTRRRRLILARDRLGEKPLVYYHQPGRLLFGSELKAILQAPGVPRRLNYQALDEYLTYQYVPFPHTIYKDIHKLPPAHYAIYEQDRMQVVRYWEPPQTTTRPPSAEQVAEELNTLLADAVRLRLQSDVPLGAFLSGGIDSSLVVAMMCRHAEGRVRTFSIGFPHSDYDERRYARQVAEHLGTEHEEFEVTPDAVEILPRLVYHYDEPFADSSAVPTWYLSELTRRHVTVALTGDGGDELFLGYPRYVAMRWSGAIERSGWLRSWVASPLWQRLPAPARQKSRLRQWKRFAETMARPPLDRYLDWIAIFQEHRRALLYSQETIARLPDQDPRWFLQKHWPPQESDLVHAVARLDLQTYLPCDLMYKVDTASMAHALECRQPMLDHRLVEWAARLPRAWKLRWWKGKRVLRDVFGRLLPPAIWRRRKMGFGVPLDHWFRGPLQPLLHDLLLASDSSANTLFRRETIATLIEEHTQSRFDHAYRLWALLVFEMWRRQWNPEL